MESVEELTVDIKEFEGQDVDKNLNLGPNDIEALRTTGNFAKRLQISQDDFNTEALLMMEAEDDIKHWETLDTDEDTGFHRAKENMKPVEGVDGLFMRTLQPGDGPQPMEGALVFVHYSVHQDGRKDPIDSTKMHGKPWMFRVGSRVVNPGLDHIVRNMKQGGEVEAYLEPGFGLFLAEKFNDVNKRVDMEKAVYVKVELLDVNNNKSAKTVAEMIPVERMMAPFSLVYEAAMLQKEEGNKYVKKKSLGDGVGRYMMAFRWLKNRCNHEETEEDELKKRELQATLLINVALICCKQGKFRQAKDFAENALKYAKASDRVIKARLYAARGCRGLTEYKEALEHVREGKKVGHHELLVEEETGILEKMKVAKKEGKDLYKKMVGALMTPNGEEEEEKTAEAMPLELQEQVDNDLEAFIYDESQTVYNIPESYTESQKRFVVVWGEKCGLEIVRKEKVPVSLNKPFNFRPLV